MTKHFENRAAAVTELGQFGFRETATGRWVNSACVATIHPLHHGPGVRVHYVARVPA